MLKIPVEDTRNHKRNWNPELQRKARLVVEIF
jgi:hypothetical protein